MTYEMYINNNKKKSYLMVKVKESDHVQQIRAEMWTV